MFEPGVFRKQMYCIEEVLVTLLGLSGHPSVSALLAPLSMLLREGARGPTVLSDLFGASIVKQYFMFSNNTPL